MRHDPMLLDLKPFAYAERALAMSAQGLLNRDAPRVFLRWDDASRPYDPAWIDYLPGRYGFAWREVDSLGPLLDAAKPLAKGLVVWDEDVPDTLNVATTLAGLDDLLIVTRDLLRLVEPLGLPVAEDLAGRFTHANRTEIYRWSFEEHFPRCDKRWPTCMDQPIYVIADLRPFAAASPRVRVRFEAFERKHEDGGFDGTAKSGADVRWLRVRDGSDTPIRFDVGTAGEAPYRVDPLDQSHPEPDFADRRVFEYALDVSAMDAPVLVADPRGTFVASVSTDGGASYTEIARRESGLIYGGHHRYYSTLEACDFAVARRQFCFALSSRDDEPEQRALFDQVLHALDPDAAMLGWTTAESDELSYLQQISKAGRVVVGGHSNPNISLMQHLRPEQLRFPDPPPPPELDPGKVYLSFIIGDGDALWVHYYQMRGFFHSAARGRMPLGWGIQPLLLDLAPCILGYYLEHATDEDAFLASACGVGYSHPELMPPEALDRFLDRTRDYLRRLNLRGIHYLEEPRAAGFDGMHAAGRRAYAEKLGDIVSGVQEGYWSFKSPDHAVLDTPDGPFTWMQTKVPDVERWGGPEYDNMLADIRRMAAEGSRPLFIPCHPWNDIGIGADEAQRLMRDLGEGFAVVRPDHMMHLIAEHMTGTANG